MPILSKKSAIITIQVLEEYLEQPEGYTSFSRIYQKVADKQGMKSGAIERSVRSAAKDLKEIGSDFYLQCFPEKTVPKNSVFLSRAAIFCANVSEALKSDAIARE